MEGTQASREILFHGKNRTLDKWVEGYYKKNGKDVLIGEELRAGTYHYVDPASVGQYVNRTDKNGTRIFEGDVVQFYKEINGETFQGKYVVYYEDAYCAFMLREIDSTTNMPSELPFGSECQYYEVIGNVYDNPELLEVTK
jgi:uncharacterized phage protein (TIGR01671 family)